jgi:NAD(P)-dependent dehydrogenase (short-subunit alcohol dehydrogenase family)
MKPGRALVIGNTDGIGLALTKRLLEAGWTVAGLSRRPSPVAAARYHHSIVDVTSSEYRSALAALAAQWGACDTCIYCAGIGELLDVRDLSLEANIFRTNLVGAVETAAAVLPPMLAAGRGHLVCLSSIGDGVSPEAPSYAASKAGLSAYFEGLALALRPRGVFVTNVRLGFVDTKMAKAKSRPFMVDVDRAVAVILACLEQRPARLTYPRRMAALMTLVRWVTSLRLWRA